MSNMGDKIEGKNRSSQLAYVDDDLSDEAKHIQRTIQNVDTDLALITSSTRDLVIDT